SQPARSADGRKPTRRRRSQRTARLDHADQRSYAFGRGRIRHNVRDDPDTSPAVLFPMERTGHGARAAATGAAAAAGTYYAHLDGPRSGTQTLFRRRSLGLWPMLPRRPMWVWGWCWASPMPYRWLCLPASWKPVIGPAAAAVIAGL